MKKLHCYISNYGLSKLIDPKLDPNEEAYPYNFFKADCRETILENCKGPYKENHFCGILDIFTRRKKFKIGKKYLFKAYRYSHDFSFTFIGLIRAKVSLNKEGAYPYPQEYLEIEIVPNKLYFYAYIQYPKQQVYNLEIMEKIE